MAEKSKHSKETVVNGLTLDEMKKKLLQKAKQVGEISMKEISETLALFEVENEEIFNFADEVEEKKSLKKKRFRNKKQAKKLSI